MIEMSAQSLFPSMIKGLSDGLFTVEISSSPSLAQEINELFKGNRVGSAFRKLADLTLGTEICVCVPEKYSYFFLPSGRYGFQVGSESKWKTPLFIESLAHEYVDEVTASPIILVEVAARALSQNTPQNEAARKALASLMNATLASVLATAHRRQNLQVYGRGTSSPVMIPVEFLAHPLILRRAFDLSFSEAVRKHQDRLQELTFQETIQEIAPGIGFKAMPAFQMPEEQDQVVELQKAYITAAWVFSDEFVRIIANSDTDYSQVRKLWRKAVSLMDQIDGLKSQTAGTPSKAASAQSPVVKRWVNSYKWSLSCGIVALVVALVLKVKPLFDVGDSFALSLLVSTLTLAVAAPVVFHILDVLGYYSILTIVAVIGSLLSIIDTAIGDRTVHDQTTWIWLFVAPLMVIYEIFRDRAAKDVQTEEWRKGIV